LKLFVAVASASIPTSNKAAYSSDGITWTRIAPGGVSGSGLDSNIFWSSVIWAKELGLFVAVGNNGSTCVMTSPDAINWTGRTVPDTSSAWTSVCWSPELGLLVAVSYAGTNIVMTSTNGITWVNRTASGAYNAVVWSAELGLFSAVGFNAAAYSSDGITWTSTTVPDTGSGWFSMVWCPEITTFVACASFVSGTNPALMTSTNGTSWQAVSGSLPTQTFNKNYFSVCWSPDIGAVVALANNSSNPVTIYNDISGWSSLSSSVLNSTPWYACAWSWSLGRFVTLSNTGGGAYSSNKNSLNILRNGSTLTQNGMLANILPTITTDRIKINKSIYAKNIASNVITSYSLLNRGIITNAGTLNNNNIINNNGVLNNSTQNGSGSGAAVTSSTNYFSLNDNPIFFRGTNGSDKTHFISYNGTSGGYAAIDGPALIGSAGGCLGSSTSASWALKWDSSNNTTFNGNTFCNNSTNYVMTRAYKGSSTASGGVVTFQLQQGLGGTTFGVNGGTYMVTMSLQSADFGLPRGFWTGIVEYSGFSGGKAQGYTITSSNASLTSVSTGGLVTITVTQSTSATYEFTQMQVCY
jgi:hypothetical protein